MYFYCNHSLCFDCSYSIKINYDDLKNNNQYFCCPVCKKDKVEIQNVQFCCQCKIQNTKNFEQILKIYSNLALISFKLSNNDFFSFVCSNCDYIMDKQEFYFLTCKNFNDSFKTKITCLISKIYQLFTKYAFCCKCKSQNDPGIHIFSCKCKSIFACYQCLLKFEVGKSFIYPKCNICGEINSSKNLYQFLDFAFKQQFFPDMEIFKKKILII